MTNKDFTRTLNDKEFAKWLMEEPWHNYAIKRYLEDKIPYEQGIFEWLEKEWIF